MMNDSTEPTLAFNGRGVVLTGDAGGLSEHRSMDAYSLWDKLDAHVSLPMQQASWNSICREVFPKRRGDPFPLAVATGPHAGAVAPLYGTTGPWYRLEMLGFRYLYEPTDFIFSDAHALSELALALAATGLPVFLGRIPADSLTIEAMQRAYRGRGLVVVRAAPPYPRILLDATWGNPETKLNAGRRSDLRRALRRAEGFGPVRFEIVAPTEEDMPKLLEEVFDVEAANWKGREGSALAHDNLRGEFYRRYAGAACRAGTLRLCFLRIGDKAVAVQLALEMQGAFWLLKIGHREEYSKCSPGMLLISESIRYSVAKNLQTYEFLGAAEAWTRVWTANERPCVSVKAYPYGPRGAVALAADLVRTGYWRARRALARVT